MSTLVTVNTEFVGSGYLALFASGGGKSSFVGRMITSGGVSRLVMTWLRTCRRWTGTMSVVMRGRFLCCLTSLDTVKREENLFKDSNGNRFLIKLRTCFKAFSFTFVDRVLFHLMEENFLKMFMSDVSTSLLGFV